MIVFIAKDITVLRFTKTKDAQGTVIPPECVATYAPAIPVLFNDDHKKYVGFAVLRRVGNELVADLELKSEMMQSADAQALVADLYPSVHFSVIYFVVAKRANYTALHIEVTAISLTPQRNVDPLIAKLGNRVLFKQREDLH